MHAHDAVEQIRQKGTEESDTKSPKAINIWTRSQFQSRVKHDIKISKQSVYASFK